MLSGTSAGEAWSLQRSRTTSLGGGVLTIPGDAPASPPATTTLNTHAILLGASSLTSAAVRRWRFYVPVQEISYRYFPPGCGRSWPERPGSQWCHQVCCRPPRRVEKASLMDSPGAPELQNVTAGQNVFLNWAHFLVLARNQALVHHVRLAPLIEVRLAQKTFKSRWETWEDSELYANGNEFGKSSK